MENIKLRDIKAQGPGSVLEELARRGAQQMLAQAMEAEVALFIDKHADKIDENGHRKVVRNGAHAGAGVGNLDRPGADQAAAGRPSRSARRPTIVEVTGAAQQQGFDGALELAVGAFDAAVSCALPQPQPQPQPGNTMGDVPYRPI